MTLGISIGGTPITGVYVGGTLATGVYFGSTKIWPALADIEWIGASPNGNIVISSGVTTVPFPLPAGSLAGDRAAFLCNGKSSDGTLPITSPTLETVLSPDVYDATNEAFLAAYLYTLTSADISAGQVTLTINAAVSISAGMEVFRGPEMAASAGVMGSGAIAQGAGASMTAPGVTLPDGAVAMYLAGLPVGGSPVSYGSAPTGYTLDVSENAAICPVLLARSPIEAAGPTGDETMTVSTTTGVGPAGDHWGAVLIALRKKVPAITLSATFPTSTNVGDTVSFDVTAILVDGATGAPTITVDQLPAGLTLGATSMVDSTHYKATVSGTLTTAQSVTSTFSATGGSVGATPLVHAFDVVAAAKLAQPVALNNVQGTSITATLAAAPKAGNTLIAWLVHNSKAVVTPPAGFSQLLYMQVDTSFGMHVWEKTSDGTEQSATIGIDTSRYLGAGLAEWTGSGAYATVDSGGVTVSSSSNAFGPSSQPVANAVPFALFGINGPPTNPSVSAGWTGDFFPNPLSFDVPAAATMNSVPSGSVSGSLSYTGTTNQFGWAIVWMKP